MPSAQDAPIDDDEYILGYLNQLKDTSFTEIKHFSELTGTYLSAWDVEAISYLGMIRENMQHKAYKKDCDSPMSQKTEKQSSFFSQFIKKD